MVHAIKKPERYQGQGCKKNSINKFSAKVHAKNLFIELISNKNMEFYFTLQLAPSFLIPSFTNIVSNKHHFVKADCIKFTPINTVNHIHFGLTYTESTTLNKTITPTITLKYVFNILINF